MGGRREKAGKEGRREGLILMQTTTVPLLSLLPVSKSLPDLCFSVSVLITYIVEF